MTLDDDDALRERERYAIRCSRAADTRRADGAEDDVERALICAMSDYSCRDSAAADTRE